MILLDDVTLTYPDGDARITAVDHVTLEGRPGVLTGITGPSGSGKSSLLALAATLVRPDAGRVVIGGVDATDLSAAERTTLRRERIGIVFQQPQLLPALTAREQLRVMAELGGRGGRERRAAVRGRVDQLLDAVGLGAHADRRPAQLSGGQRQRVAIARALVHEPRVLLVDEPTSALDGARGSEIMALLSRLTRERQTATLLVTHDLVHAGTLDERVEVVDGRACLAPARGETAREHHQPQLLNHSLRRLASSRDSSPRQESWGASTPSTGVTNAQQTGQSARPPGYPSARVGAD